MLLRLMVQLHVLLLRLSMRKSVPAQEGMLRVPIDRLNTLPYPYLHDGALHASIALLLPVGFGAGCFATVALAMQE